MRNHHRLLCVITLLSALLQGCSTTKSYHPLPPALEAQVEMPGFHHVRVWADTHSEILTNSIIASNEQEKRHNHGQLKPVAYGLSLSGGGRDGAFGAGLLCGWSQTGKRPEFKVVTGISTGALIAPFAFLGPAYDDRLRFAYTTTSDKDIYTPKGSISALLSILNISPSASLTDNTPLRHLIAKLVDQPLLDNIAREHHKGRRLFIGTSQMNAQRLVIWDMGAIAASDSPDALTLFRKILIASAAIPVTFPPEYFVVTANGKTYDEMHADGGVETQMTLIENTLVPDEVHEQIQKNQRDRKMYIIHNQKIAPEWKNVKPELRAIAVRSIDSLIKSHSISDLFKVYAYAKRDKVDYNLAYIPGDFDVEAKSDFDNDYMRQLFMRGYQMGKAGYPWQHYPPRFTP